MAASRLLPATLVLLWLVVSWRPVSLRFPPRVASSMHHITSGGRDRTHRDHVPPKHPALVVILHGGGGTAVGTEGNAGFDAESDRAGFIAVYPDATDRSWADGRGV